MTMLVLQTTDGNSTISDIGEACGMGASLAQRIVSKLIQDNMLHIDGFEPPTEAQDSLATEADTFYNLPGDTLLYELLDINADASRKELRNRYFELSKRFHPDKIGIKTDHDLKRKLEALFGRLTMAYDILSNPKSREEYDKSVKARLDLWMIERKLKSAIEEKREDKKKAASEPAPTDRPSVSQTITAKEPSGTARPVRRSSPGSAPARTSQSTAKSSSSPPQTKRTSTRPDLDVRRRKLKQQRAGKAMKDLLARVSGSPSSPFDSKGPRPSKSPAVSSVPPGSTLAHELVKKAELAIERTNYEQAINYLKQVEAGDPNNPQVKHMMKKAQAGFDRSRTYQQLSKGRQSQRAGNYDEAKACFEQAIHIDPTSMDARHLLADVLLETRSDLPRALSMARDIVSKGGQHARYFATLGELYLLNKQYAEARSALNKALEKTPGNDRYKKLLKACKN
jgi:curved DNA-binding protein CbpA